MSSVAHGSAIHPNSHSTSSVFRNINGDSSVLANTDIHRSHIHWISSHFINMQSILLKHIGYRTVILIATRSITGSNVIIANRQDINSEFRYTIIDGFSVRFTIYINSHIASSSIINMNSHFSTSIGISECLINGNYRSCS